MRLQAVSCAAPAAVVVVVVGACSVDFIADQAAYDRLRCGSDIQGGGRRPLGGCGAFDGGGSSGDDGGAGAAGAATGGSAGSGGSEAGGTSSGGTSGSSGAAGSAGNAGSGGAGTGGVADSGADADASDAGPTCVTGTKRCTGSVAEMCIGGQWTATVCTTPTPECDAGECVVCMNGSGRCNGSTPELCVARAWQPQSACVTDEFCQAGQCVVPPSCVGLTPNCGPNENCCKTVTVPGGTYFRDNDGMYPATVDDVLLDKYEVTVGRFRKFVAGYPGNLPAAGDGAHPKVPGSGWDSSWNTPLPLTAGLLAAAVECGGSYTTWTDTPGVNETKPINCLEWHIAFAFCAWDRGRLPTEAEWGNAACGGSEQRRYPWGDTDPGQDTTLAVYGCWLSAGMCSGASIARVGSALAGAGRWGHMDLGGSMREWMLDTYQAYQVPCVDCTQLTPNFYQAVRSAQFSSPGGSLLNSQRGYEGSSGALGIGLRCAR